MKQAKLLAAAAFTLFVATCGVADAQCPGLNAIENQRFATNYGFGSNQATGCTAGVPSGDATACVRSTQSSSPSANFFRAIWPNASARTMDAVGGCRWACGTPSAGCRVGNDGLPVELLTFAID